MDRYFTSADCCKLCDDIEKFHKDLKRMNAKEEVARDLAERIYKLQLEENRISKAHRLCQNTLDSVEDIMRYLKTETHWMLVHVENIGRDIFDYERSHGLV